MDQYVYHNGTLERKERRVVEEYPLVLHVNGREIATLIASPHDLRFLVAGFLRLQGFVQKVEDFHMLAVCDDYGVANARIKGELPERLKPVLTSGCGTGITFTLPGVAEDGDGAATEEPASISPAAVFRAMAELNRLTENYRTHGGIHSAAVADGEGGLILHSEDIGRHNTLDRIAGEALLKGIDLAGRVLVTSGRVSSEMAAKASLLKISLIASRTSPTDKAIELCDRAGITLIGYVRGDRFTIYSHPERVDVGTPSDPDATATTKSGRRIPGMTGVILAGGASSRMGSNKALLPFSNGRFIDAIYRLLDELFDEVIVVTNTPEQYAFLPCRKVPDVHVGIGALAGIHGGLVAAGNDRAFITACDMPFLNGDLIRHLATRTEGYDAVIPCTPGGFEPLHGIYSRSSIPALESSLNSGIRKIMDVYDRLNIRLIPPGEVARLDPEYRSFCNINTPEEYYRLRESAAAQSPEVSTSAL